MLEPFDGSLEKRPSHPSTVSDGSAAAPLLFQVLKLSHVGGQCFFILYPPELPLQSSVDLPLADLLLIVPLPQRSSFFLKLDLSFHAHCIAAFIFSVAGNKLDGVLHQSYFLPQFYSEIHDALFQSPDLLVLLLFSSLSIVYTGLEFGGLLLQILMSPLQLQTQLSDISLCRL